MNNIITDHIFSSLSITVMLSESTYVAVLLEKLKRSYQVILSAHSRFRAQVIKSMLVRYCVILSKITQSISCFEQRLQRPSTGQRCTWRSGLSLMWCWVSVNLIESTTNERKYIYQLNSRHSSRHHDQLSCISFCFMTFSSSVCVFIMISPSFCFWHLKQNVNESVTLLEQ